METQKYKQPWLNSAWSDMVFIISPAFLSLMLVFLFPSHFQQSAGIPLAYWVMLVVFVNVAHVYSTLYRTYFNPNNRKNKLTLLLSIPLICYILSVILYHIDGLLFWRALAYLAVYHFIRQQYGFMKLYGRAEKAMLIDQIAIYAATLYPLIFWHLNGNRNFSWFIDGDFMSFQNEWLLKVSGIIYVLIIATYCIKETIVVFQRKQFNIPKNLLILGTFLSWYFGIVYFNGDMAFTTLNVISHGIPYVALIWFFEKKKMNNNSKTGNKLYQLSFGKYGIFYFVMILILFAYVEEGLWDGLIWKEHTAAFSPFAKLPQIASKELLALFVPLLALPQATHYVLDGFIWRKKENF